MTTPEEIIAILAEALGLGCQHPSGGHLGFLATVADDGQDRIARVVLHVDQGRAAYRVDWPGLMAMAETGHLETVSDLLGAIGRPLAEPLDAQTIADVDAALALFKEPEDIPF